MRTNASSSKRVLKREIIVLVEENRQASKHTLNLFYAKIGEILPSNVETIWSNIRKDAIPFKVDSHKLIACIALLKEQLLIARFVGKKPNPQGLGFWFKP